MDAPPGLASSTEYNPKPQVKTKGERASEPSE